MITVYVDVLFAVNFITDYFMLKATSFVCKRAREYRVIFGAIVGALYGSFMFLLQMNFFITLLLNILAAFTMILATFGLKGKKAFFKETGVFFGVNFLCCGIVLPLFLTGKVFISNGVLYFSSGIRKLIIGFFAAYIVIKVLCISLDKLAVSRSSEVNVKITLNDKTVTTVAISDTGNSLTEPFTGLPVLILERRLYRELSPEGEKMYIIPYKTVSGERRVMMGIMPHKVTVTEISGKTYDCKGIVAVTDIHIRKGMEAIINPSMLSGTDYDGEFRETEKLYNKKN